MVTNLVSVERESAFAGSAAFREATRAGRSAGQASFADNPLEELIQLTRSNDDLLAQIKAARRRLGQALAYAADPEARHDLGTALVCLALRKQMRLESRLRANRSQGLTILAGMATSR